MTLMSWTGRTVRAAAAQFWVQWRLGRVLDPAIGKFSEYPAAGFSVYSTALAALRIEAQAIPESKSCSDCNLNRNGQRAWDSTLTNTLFPRQGNSLHTNIVGKEAKVTRVRGEALWGGYR